MSNQEGITGSLNVTLDDVIVHATGTVEDAIQAVKNSREIPEDVKPAITDFIQEKFDELLEHADQLFDFPVPEVINEWWPVVISILQRTFS